MTAPDVAALAAALHEEQGIERCPAGLGHDGWNDCPVRDWWMAQATDIIAALAAQGARITFDPEDWTPTGLGLGAAYEGYDPVWLVSSPSSTPDWRLPSTRRWHGSATTRRRSPTSRNNSADARRLPMADCIVWGGTLTDEGYGTIYIDGRTHYVHRIAYEEAKGPIPPGLTIDHLCRNRACINPDHLEAVTNRENILRGESPTARHARQTECKNGHPLSGDNLRIRPDGSRACIVCHRDQSRASDQKMRVTRREEYRAKRRAFYAANSERILARERARKAKLAETPEAGS